MAGERVVVDVGVRGDVYRKRRGVVKNYYYSYNECCSCCRKDVSYLSIICLYVCLYVCAHIILSVVIGNNAVWWK